MSRPSEFEANFDGLPGPTHNYAGLSPGNLASVQHGGQIANPRAAALQGLEKMRYVARLGVPQAVLPPQPRPDVSVLRRLGFSGSDADVVRAASKHGGLWLRLCSSASAMWTANAATVCPARDAEDSRLHLTVANLSAMFHRSIEGETTTRVLSRIFMDEERFAVHPPLLPSPHLGDEGAANHLRLVSGENSLQVFAWGRQAWPENDSVPRAPAVHPARQTLEASRAVARLNRVKDAVFWQQDPRGIDAGAFHTDVLGVGHQNVLMLHEWAFVDHTRRLDELRRALPHGLSVVVATQSELPAEDAVRSYPFNSQLVRDAGGMLHIIAPGEARDNPAAKRFLERVIDEVDHVERVHYLNVNASMNNGGGPACLRLRVAMTEQERQATLPGVWLDEALSAALEEWIGRRYRDRLTAEDLADPQLLLEVRQSLDELSSMLGLGSVYDFQLSP